jgi:putative redox protein
MKVTSMWIQGLRSETDNGRGHCVVVDMPKDKEGTDLAPTALELSVMALAGCITTIYATMAKKRRWSYEAMIVELDAERPQGAPTIEKIRGRVTVRTTASREEVETTLRLTMSQCPVGIIFDKAGLTPTLEVHVEGVPQLTAP